MGQNLIDFRNFIKSEKLNQFAKGISDGLSHGLGGYEKRVKSMVKELDLKSRDARVKSREQLDRFAKQLKTTRSQLEKRVVTLVHSETERLNKGLNELVTYLKTLSKQEKKKAAKSKSGGAKKSASSKRSTPRKKVSLDSASPVVN